MILHEPRHYIITYQKQSNWKQVICIGSGTKEHIPTKRGKLHVEARSYLTISQKYTSQT